MPRRHKPTLKQVAQLAKVSSTTASMILNQQPGFSFNHETVARVKAAAQRLNYFTDSPAAPGDEVFQHRVIVIFAPTITGYFYTSLIQAIEQAAYLENYETICYQTYHHATRELSGLSMFSHSDIAGIIFTYVPENYDFLTSLPPSIPAVIIGDHCDFIRSDMVETNNFLAGKLMGEHLLALGHRRVAFFNDFFEWSGYPTSHRLEGSLAAFDAVAGAELRVFSQPAAGELGFGNNMTRRLLGRDMAAQCLAECPEITAVIAITDVMAYGVFEVFKENGRRIPEDISVCGFDNNFASDILGLTSLDHHVFELGAQSFRLLYNKMSDHRMGIPGAIIKMELPGELIHRRSTAVPRA